MKKVILLALSVLLLLACTTVPPAGRPETPREIDTLEGEAPRVAGDFQAWADGNQNGILEQPELREFLKAVRTLVEDPHPVQTPADEFFDLDRNGHIDLSEMKRARILIFQDQLRHLYRINPELAQILDFKEEGYIVLWVTIMVHNMIFFPDSIQPREARHGFDPTIDMNHDGYMDEEEIEEFTRFMFVAAALLPIPPIEEARAVIHKRDVFAYVDMNANGSIEGREVSDLIHLSVMTLGCPDRSTLTPLDEYFDRNRDGRLDIVELKRAWAQVIEAPLRHSYEIEPELASQFIDFNSNNRIDDEEINAMFELIFGDPPFSKQWMEPHRVSDPLDERLDRNRDGMVDYEEFEPFYEGMLIRAMTLAWLEIPEEREEGWEVASVLDELADLNGDGFVDSKENRTAREALQGPHPVESEFDQRIDFNRNGQVEVVEIRRVQRTGAFEEEMPERAPRSLPAVTLIDQCLDLNKDGRVDEEEINRIVELFLLGRKNKEVPEKWLKLLDLDRNGKVSQDEFIESREMYLRPHPVNPDFRLDSKLDKNRDGFVSPEDIGIAAGFVEGRPILSFDERLEQLGWEQERVTQDTGKEPEKRTFESDYYKKLGIIQNKKLAVMGIKTGTKNVDSETAGGIMVFIENAFVNVGKVRVVDRQNISKILKEHEFQQSDLTDETTAVKIGKLSGADIIVIGSISYVGKKYYLNIKTIMVETAEIVGSSIADATDATEFYEMCNEAVFKLF